MGGPCVPTRGVGTREYRRARTVSATTAERVRKEVKAGRRLWFPSKLKGPVIFQEADGINEPLRRVLCPGGCCCVQSWPVRGG